MPIIFTLTKRQYNEGNKLKYNTDGMQDNFREQQDMRCNHLHN